MSMPVTSKRSSRRRAVDGNDRSHWKMELDLNAYPDGTPSPAQLVGPPGVLGPANVQPIQHSGPTLPPPNAPIDVEAIEDEVQLLSSSRGFPQGRNQSRRNRLANPVTVILDEDSEVHPGPSEEPTRLSLNSYKDQPKRPVVNCDIDENLENNHNAKRKCLMKCPEPEKVTFNCSICWGPLVEETSTICGHIFCGICIKASIRAQKKCPTCRRSLNMKGIHRVYLPTTD